MRKIVSTLSTVPSMLGDVFNYELSIDIMAPQGTLDVNGARFDLFEMFGGVIIDHIYSMEAYDPGSGIRWLISTGLFPGGYGSDREIPDWAKQFVWKRKLQDCFGLATDEEVNELYGNLG